MSQRLAMIMAVALTLVLGTGVYAARGRVVGTQSAPTSESIVIEPTVAVSVSRQNPPMQTATEVPSALTDAVDMQSGFSESGGDDDGEESESEEHEGAESGSSSSSSKTSETTKHETSDSSEHEDGEDD